MSNPVWQWTATKTATAIADGVVSSHEVTTAHIARMNEVNPALNAVVNDLSDQALLAAAEADKAVARGDNLGPLHGVPITIKENVDFQSAALPTELPGHPCAIN